MAIAPTYPGVYVQEIPSGVRTIVGVGTSIAMFIGTAKKGPMFKPIRCTSYADYARRFSEDSTGGNLLQYVKLFFLNGGTDCYAMRIANGATQSTVALKNEAGVGAEVLRLTARDAGLAGENIRTIVTYSGPQPEALFNLELFRWETDSAGNRTRKDTEVWKGLSMDPLSPLFAPAFITQNSKLVSATLGVAVPAVTAGVSLSGRAIPTANLKTTLDIILGPPNPATKFQISVDRSPYVEIDLTGIATSNTPATMATNIQTIINNRFVALGMPTTQVVVAFPVGPGGFLRLDVRSAGTGDVFIAPGTQADITVPLMLGTAQGGVEISGRAMQRPAPNGITFKGFDPAALNQLADLAQNALVDITLDIRQTTGTLVGIPVTMQAPVPPPSVTTTAPADKMMKDAVVASLNGNSDGVREKLAIIAQRINAFVPAPPATWKWRAEVWGTRLAILPLDSDDNFLSPKFDTTPPGLKAQFSNNVRFYSLGAGGNNIGRQTSGPVASDGTSPTAADYDAAYDLIDKEVDLFNLMVLPPDAAVPTKDLYPKASIRCQARRAFLLMDAPATWGDAQTASTGVNALRVGLVKDHAAIFFPRITIDDNGLQKNIGPSGAIAGLCARIDATRGVWKAPAGTEADLRGIIGLEQKFSDGENGILNPRAVNTIRIFPNGIVNWGARTMDGDDDFASEYKYIPIRRLALFIEESLYRGLKWVVFEPNDEPLWGQIRLNVGAFMHNLFRQGAFQGATPRDAYFVKCDKDTTTQNDRNLGIVNIVVGFAPLKPAEFVILHLQQMAGQIQV